MEEKLFNGYNRSGNPRYIAHTKENALKVMKKNRGAAKEGMGGVFGQIRAKLAPEFKSIQAIKDKANSFSRQYISQKKHTTMPLTSTTI